MGPVRIRRVPLLALGVVSLVAALWAGLARIGWGLPLPSAALTGIHGPLAIGGFLGTLICLERAVALGSAWAYGAPLCAGLGGVTLPPKPVRVAFLVASAIYAAGVAATLVRPDAAVRVEGAGALLLAAWLARYDLARRTVRSAGLTRFIAVCLLSGYVWLAVHGALRVAWGDAPAGTRYDAILHTLLLGFAMSMVFGHAPVIFPSVLGAPVPYRPEFYAHVALLHASLAVRVAGDLAVHAPLRQWGGLLNAAAIVLFFLNTIASAGRRAPTSLTPVP